MDLAPTVSGSSDIFVTRRTLFDYMRQSGDVMSTTQYSNLKEFIENRTNCPNHCKPMLQKRISFFMSDFKKRWQKCFRKEDRFLISNKSWLDSAISFKNYSGTDKKCGRPRKSFDEASERTKRQKTEELRQKHSSEELIFAAQMSLRSSGEVEASKVVREVTTNSPKRAAKYRLAYKKFEGAKKKQLSGREALSMFVEAKLTRHQYNIIRLNDKSKFPSYKKIQLAKKECYPPKEHITVTDTVAEIKLQALLNHTVNRLLDAQKEVLEAQQTDTLKNLELICKWGLDGSAQSEYKQHFSDPNARDSSIFIVSLVPIRLISNNPGEQQQLIIWQNERPSTTRYCRPIKFIFQHETTELAKNEVEIMRKQIEELQQVTYQMNNIEIHVTIAMLFTMVDGKICNAITDTKSTQRCFVCGLTSKDFNKIEKVSNTNIIDNSRLEFGLSVLHAWIRFFECLLHLSYKLPLMKWQARGEEEKKIVADRKKEIQSKFKSEMGLVVDKPKPGFGSSNDGNTARRFFSDPEVVAKITGLDIQVIKRFKIVLQTIASTYEINVDKFQNYAIETARLFVEKYSWYPMPPSIHKVLIHGPAIIEQALLPIGQLSEEAQEARNKEFKRYRENFSRKISRVKTNEDILNSLLISSDPLITSLRKLPQKRVNNIDKDVLDLLKAPDYPFTSDTSGTSANISSDNSSDTE